MKPGAEAAAEEGAAALATEDAVQALLDHFVGPCLPNKASVREKPPPLAKQEAVGKQLHGVVLLYNYFLRKRFPHLEPLDFTSFCKLATIAKPSLLPYLQYMQDPSHKNGEKGAELSVAEKKVMDACLICVGLDPRLGAPTMCGWPVSKVAVLVADRAKEKCFLRFGSITQGVWSPVEKDVPAAVKINKAICVDDYSLQKLAFAAVKDQIGINEADLTITDGSLSYSLSQVKSATRFFIMQCTASGGVISSDFRPIPISLVVASLQCPIVVDNPPVATPSAEHFHLLPYFDTLMSWFSRAFSETIPGTQANDSVNQKFERVQGKQHAENLALVLIPEPREKTKDHNESRSKEDVINRNSSEVSSASIQNKCSEQDDQSNTYSHLFHDTSIKAETAKKETTQKTENYSCTIEITQKARTPKKSNDAKASGKVLRASLYNQSENNVAPEVFCKRKNLFENASTFNDVIFDKAVAGKINNGKDLIPKSTKNSNLTVNNGTHGQDDMSAKDPPILALPSSFRRCETTGQKTTLRESSHLQIDVISQMKRRDELHSRYSQLGEELMQCEMDIQTTLAGEQTSVCNGDPLVEAHTVLALNAIVPSITSKSAISYSPSTIKRRRLSEAVLFQNVCQVLNDICRTNNWILPQYIVLPLPEKGGFRSIIFIVGPDFELTERGEVKKSLQESKESAASCMLKKLLTTT